MVSVAHRSHEINLDPARFVHNGRVPPRNYNNHRRHHVAIPSLAPRLKVLWLPHDALNVWVSVWCRSKASLSKYIPQTLHTPAGPTWHLVDSCVLPWMVVGSRTSSVAPLHHRLMLPRRLKTATKQWNRFSCATATTTTTTTTTT